MNSIKKYLPNGIVMMFTALAGFLYFASFMGVSESYKAEERAVKKLTWETDNKELVVEHEQKMESLRQLLEEEKARFKRLRMENDQ